MKRFSTYIIATVAFFVFTMASCDKKTPTPVPPSGSTLTIGFKMVNGGKAMAWNDITKVDGVNEMQFDLIKFYLSNISIENADGNLIFLKDVILANAADPKTMQLTFDAEAGNYEALVFGVGLDPVQNASDPLDFDPTNPLSAAAGMYWSWGMQYRFAIIDGRANENGNIGNTDDILMAYHPGADAFYETTRLAKPFTLTNGATTALTVNIDVAHFFDGPGGVIDIPQEPQTHTSPPLYDLAQKFMKNFVASFNIK